MILTITIQLRIDLSLKKVYEICILQFSNATSMHHWMMS